MTTAIFEQPDRTQAPQSSDAEAYKNAIEASIKVVSELAAAFAVHENTTPDLNVIIDGGVQFDGTTIIEQTAQTIGPVVVPLVNPRIDIVELDPATGTAYIVTGVEAATPVKPAVTDGRVPLAYFQLATSTSVILNSMIVPLRYTPWGGSGGGGDVAGYVKGGTEIYLPNYETAPLFNILVQVGSWWRMIGPPGTATGGSYEIGWLGGLPAGYKWIDLRIKILKETHATQFGSLSLFVRPFGSGSTSDMTEAISISNAAASAQTNFVADVRIPVDELGRFEMYLIDSGGSLLVCKAYLIGFGV